MLSILIPIYNWDCTQLVRSLLSQCRDQNINFEVLCYDDASEDKYKVLNQVLSDEMGVAYIQLQTNNGRAKIRNKLGFNARYNNLLFLDCDGKIESSEFISNYLSVIQKHAVVYGGMAYPKEKPKQSSKVLRWKYGRIKESLSAAKRQRIMYEHFMTNNFFVKRDLFLDIKFDESIVGYGYEDSVFAADLRNRNVEIKHIDNPLMHEEIDNADIYLEKVKKSIVNLVQLLSNHKLRSTSLSTSYDRLTHLRLLNLFLRFIEKRKAKIESNLKSANPSLFQFNLWKLYQFALEKQKSNL